MTNKWPMWLGLLLGLAAVWLGFTQSDMLADQWGAAARLTARVGFPLFLMAYVARPLHQLWRSNTAKMLLARRKWFGLGFALSHSVHLVSLYMAITVSGGEWNIVTLIFGGGAYATLYAMAFTSNSSAMKAMGKKWKWLHRFGIHYLWFIFFQSYLGRIFQPETQMLGIVMTSFAIIAACIRFAAWIKRRRAPR